jgi:sec-independent protein translocase protein TatA
MEIGVPELLIVLFVILLIFGPGRIASLGRELGASIRQFRQGLNESPDQDKPEEEKSSDEE